MIRYIANGTEILPDITNYPDGTQKINLPLPEDTNTVRIKWHYDNETELATIIFTTKNLQQRGNKVELFMPYLPNARMDRTHKESEVFTLKYFCDTINWLGFTKVIIIDAHSSVGVALLDRCENISPEAYIKQAIEQADIDKDNDYIFFPDEGSCKRYSGMFTGYKNIGFGIKKRNWENGEIEGLDVVGANPEGRKVFIVDDICAYGGTVYFSALKLKEMGCANIHVFFTHCENSIIQGKLWNNELITGIYTTNSICTLNATNQFKIINV